MRQNTSHAVMAQRHDRAPDALDFFPTPPWATRALCEHVLPRCSDIISGMVAWEPACGADDMVRPLAEYFNEVIGTDVHDYGPAAIHDFLQPYLPRIVEARPGPHWVITNPPFRLAAEFVQRGLDVASDGVAVLVRTVFMEGGQRHRELFQPHPPIIVAPFCERVPMVKGRVDRKASSATSYAWFVWSKTIENAGTSLVWIPPCRKALERDEDYLDHGRLD